MSRCFPFPPPGYEKKPRSDDDDLLKKEKRKEKKHKEKKDREKKEGKGKRDKERSDGKRREKKDKKEKHRDKKKDKEKDREKDKEKGCSTEAKTFSGQLEGCNGEKLRQREKERGKELCSTSEDGRHIGKLEGCNGEMLHNRVEQSRDKKDILDQKKAVMQLQDHKGEKNIKEGLLYKDFEDSKFVLELEKRVKDEGKGRATQLVEGFMHMDWKDEGSERFAVGGSTSSMAVESTAKKVDRELDGQRTIHEANFYGNSVAQNFAGSIQNKVGVPKPTEKTDRRIVGKDKEGEVEDKKREKHKSESKEKQSQGKDKNREKEKRYEDKAKEKREHKKSEKDKTKRSKKSDTNGDIHKTIHLSKDGDETATPEGNLKRKDVEKNGFLHGDAFRPEKLPKLTSVSLPENGKKSETSQTSIHFNSHRQGTVYNIKADDKDHKVNGSTGAEKPPLLVQKPSVIAEKMHEASKRPPHPDTKHLSELLTVPQMDEWSAGFDDQEWLFDKKDSALKKSDMEPAKVNPDQHVWAEAVQLNSADVYALPYVIPY